MKILLVTSGRDHCGIREYGRFLQAGFAGDKDIEIVEHADPDSLTLGAPECNIIHLNHHAALHASWTEARVKDYQKAGYLVTVTQHDTFEDFSVMLERGFPDFRKANGLVVHEPVAGLTDAGQDEEPTNCHYIPQGVLPRKHDYFSSPSRNKAAKLLGTVGFDFPWKNFDLAAKIAESAGWSLLLISPDIKKERVEEIQGMNPSAIVLTDWHEAEMVVDLLGGCDATAFLYSTGNSGTSGAIRLGVAARRPMIAFASRQNRDLASEPAICWVKDEEDAKNALTVFEAHGYQSDAEKMEDLAERQSWKNAAKQYKAMWTEALENR